MDDRMLEELLELLRIPSVSTGEPNPEALAEAADFMADKVRRSGGEVEIVTDLGNPLVVGEFRVSDDAPTVLIYGHYDVQSIGNPELWDSDPFSPEIRDGKIYARGASDNKGNFWPLFYTACEMAKAGELPVNVRVLVEGEEEAGSEAPMRWIATDERGADAAIVFDAGTIDPSMPAITCGARGVIAFDVRVRGAVNDLHSGIFGGAVVNPSHELMRMLAPILPGPDGVLRDELRVGIREIPEVERRSWERLPDGDALIELGGGRPVAEDSGERFYIQTVGEPSVDVTQLLGGEPRTIVPALVGAHVTMRLAPGQDAEAMASELQRLIREAAHPRVDVSFSEPQAVDAAAFDVESPPLRLAREAFEAACGQEPLLIRLGGSIPILSPFEKRGIQTILSGFACLDDGIHGPNESYRLSSLEAGAATSRELYRRLADLPR